jgi:hypothetical protein
VLGYQLGWSGIWTGSCSGSVAGVRVMGRLKERASWRVSAVVDIDAHVAAAEQFELAKVDIDGASGDVPDDHVVRPGAMHRCGQVVRPAWPGQYDVLPPGIGAEPAYRSSGSRRDHQSITQPARTATGPRAFFTYRARHQMRPPGTVATDASDVPRSRRWPAPRVSLGNAPNAVPCRFTRQES